MDVWNIGAPEIYSEPWYVMRGGACGEQGLRWVEAVTFVNPEKNLQKRTRKGEKRGVR